MEHRFLSSAPARMRLAINQDWGSVDGVFWDRFFGRRGSTLLPQRVRQRRYEDHIVSSRFLGAKVRN